jgi:hypothetical protein
MRKCFREIYSLHAGQFSEIAIPHSLFAGADEVIEQFELFVAVHESVTGTFRTCRSVSLLVWPGAASFSPPAPP